MSLEIQAQDRIEVYASESGYCCIHQYSVEENSAVWIAPCNVDELCRMLQTVKQQIQKGGDDA